MAIEFHQAVLPNGLTVVAEADPAAHTCAAGFFVKTGARDEDSGVMGVSHYLEHMMFKGTTKISAEELNRAFDELGARNNAYTSNEMTCFYAQVLPEHLAASLSLLGQMMRPALRGADFDMEKGVILEEIAMYKDNPFWVLYEASIDRHYAPHPMSHRVLGTTETITALSREQMQEYFDERYSADNMVLALGGRLDFAACVEQAHGLCGAWARTGARRSGAAPMPSAKQGCIELRDAKVNRGYLIAIARAPGIEDDRRYAASLLAQVLGASDNSRLHWSLVESGIAEEAQAAYDAHDGIGEYYVYAAGAPERLGEIQGVIAREIEALVESITLDDLERLRNRIATAAALNAERPGDRMQRLGRLWTYLGKYTTLDEEVAKINAVTLDDLRACARDFPLCPTTLGTLLPAGAGSV
jgi:predicted Zn-dependent peptidase